jgi:DNA-binding transcriptional LysR family regulator
MDAGRIGTPSLDQLHVLAAVAEAGSFSAAARALNRTQSVVSYTIAHLEDQLGLQLFDRGQRRPVLTEAGTAILADARRVAATVRELRARAAGLRGGLEAEVALAVDVMFPTCRLVAALDDFAREYPTVSLRLHIEALGAALQLVVERSCVLGIAGWMAAQFEALERRPIGEAVLVPVAAPTHPLALHEGPVPSEAAREQTQLVLADRSALTRGQDFGVLSRRTWRLGDLGAKHALLLAGLGWGNMPEPMVRDDIAAGRLARLNLVGAERSAYALVLINRTDTPPGPAGQWLAGRLAREWREPDQAANGGRANRHGGGVIFSSTNSIS